MSLDIEDRNALSFRTGSTKFELRSIGCSIKERKWCGKGRRVDILQNVNACVKGGEVMAIMGPSGAGKTTVLKCASLNNPNGTIRSGSVTLNNHPLTTTLFKHHCYFVHHNDRLAARLTCKETLLFAGLNCIKCPDQVQRHVNNILGSLGLKECMDVAVGDGFYSGLSTGQRKRLCVGLGLVKMPKFLFLDEPTSGLDSRSALKLCEHLYRIVKKYRIGVIESIHQPSCKIFDTFTKLLLLHKGRVAYYGLSDEVGRYFRNKNYKIPSRTELPDFLIDVLENDLFAEELLESNNIKFKTERNTSNEIITHNRRYPGMELDWEADDNSIGEDIGFTEHKLSRKLDIDLTKIWHSSLSKSIDLRNVIIKEIVHGGKNLEIGGENCQKNLYRRSRAYPQGNLRSSEKTEEYSLLGLRPKPNLFVQTWATLRKEIIMIFRDPMLYTGRCVAYFCVNIFFSLVYIESAKHDQKAILTTLWLQLWLMVAPLCFACVVFYTHVNDCMMLVRNVRNGIQHPFPFFFSKILQLPMIILMSVCTFTIGPYCMCNWGWSKYPIIIISQSLGMLSFELLAELFAVLTPHLVIGFLMFLGFWLCSFLFSGFFVEDKDVVWPLRAFFYITPLRYVIKAITYEEYIDKTFTGAEICDSYTDLSCEKGGYKCEGLPCYGYSGEQVLDSLHIQFSIISNENKTVSSLLYLGLFCGVLKTIYIFRVLWMIRHSN